MVEYFPETKSRSKILYADEFLDITFKVNKPGKIIISTAVQLNNKFSKIQASRKIELFKPSEDISVVSKTDNTSGSMMLQYNVSASETNSYENWTARVTNLEKEIEPFILQISYPGDFRIQKVVVPLPVIAKIVNSTIGQIMVQLASGKESSSIIFPKKLGMSNVCFTVPDLKHKIDMRWPTSDIHLHERVNSINSTKTTFTLENGSAEFPNGFMKLIMPFEEIGTEIIGTYNCHLSEMRLTIDIGVEMQDHNISYDRNDVRVNFSFNLDLLGVDKKIENCIFMPILKYTDHIIRIVENTIRRIFESEQMQQTFSASLTELITPLLGDNPRIFAVAIENNQVTIQYIPGTGIK